MSRHVAVAGTELFSAGEAPVARTTGVRANDPRLRHPSAVNSGAASGGGVTARLAIVNCPRPERCSVIRLVQSAASGIHTCGA